MSAHEVKRRVWEVHPVLSSQVTRTLRELRRSLLLSFTAFFIIKNTVYWNEVVKALEMQNTSYAAQQKAQCEFWMMEGHGETAIWWGVFTMYRSPAPSRLAISLWYQSYGNRGNYSHRRGNWRPAVGKEKQKQIEEMLQADPGHSLRNVGAFVGVHHTTIWQFLRKKLKIFP